MNNKLHKQNVCFGQICTRQCSIPEFSPKVYISNIVADCYYWGDCYYFFKPSLRGCYYWRDATIGETAIIGENTVAEFSENSVEDATGQHFCSVGRYK
ncbi:MAG: hypothetical protein GY861_09700 [bacterium]|nr:hypothetical protein [bacterium]